MKRKGFLLSLLVFPVLLATFTMASAAVTPYTLSLEPTTNGTDPKTVFRPGDVFYMNIVVDDAGGIAGCAFTLNFNPIVFTPPSTTADGLSITPTDITSYFPFSFVSGTTNETTHRENSSEWGKIYFSGAAIDTSTGGAKYTTGEKVLFSVKMQVKENAPYGLSGVSLAQTELFNAAAGYGVDEDGDGIFEPWDGDQKGRVPVLVGALDQNDPDFSDLTLAFPVLMGDQAGPLDEVQINVTEVACTDSDQDGVCDTYETNTGTYVSPTNTGTDPNVADTDGDGLNDGAEINAATPTNPTKVDTEGDGYSDGVDVRPVVADDPGGTNYDYTTDIRIYQVSGTIGYAGQERQFIHVGIFDDAGLTASVGSTLIDSSSGTSPWSYTITNIPARDNYYVAAYMDVDGNDQPGNEPKGQIGPFAIAAVMANKNVELALVKDWSGTWNLSFSGYKADGSPKAEVIPVTIAKEADGSYTGSFVDSESIEYDLTGEFVGENFFSVTEISGKGKAYGKGTVFGSDIAGRNDLQGAISTFRATHNPPAISNLDLTGFWSMTCSLSGSGWTADGNGPSARSFSFNAVPTGNPNEYRGTFDAEDGTCTITLTANGNRITWTIDQTGNYQAKGAGTCIIDSTSPRVMGPFSGKSLDAADPNGKDIGSFSARFTPPPSGKVVVGSPSASTYHGMTFKVPVMIDAGSSVLGSYSLKILFDKNVVNIAAVSGGSTAEFAATPTSNKNNTDGSVTLVAYQAGTESPTGVVHVADLTFNAVGRSGSKTGLTIDTSWQNHRIFDWNSTPISVTAKNGWVSVGPARVDVGTVAPLKVMSGETIYVPVSIAWAVNEVIGSYDFRLTFDPTLLQAHGVSGGQTSEFGGAPAFSIDNTNGVVSFNGFNSSDVSPVGFASVSGVTLQANSELQEDTKTVVGLNVVNLFDYDAKTIGSYVEGVKVQVTTGLCGDVNQNDDVDIGDAMFIAQYLVGNRDASTMKLALGDVNKIPGIDIGDAMFIAQFLVGNRTCICVDTPRELCAE